MKKLEYERGTKVLVAGIKGSGKGPTQKEIDAHKNKVKEGEENNREGFSKKYRNRD